MIRELHIKNLALIEELTLEFNEGFTVFTGETGAGKSILVGAIGLLLGERASTDMIRGGYEEAEISGIFEISSIKKNLAAVLNELTIAPEDDALIIRRKITRSDRNRIHINQVPVPLSALKRIGDCLIDFHGQHDHQSLLNEETHISIIDGLTGISEIFKNYSAAFQAYSEAKSRFENHMSKASALSERKEILEFQYKELKSLDLKPGEEAELEAELSLLSSSAERSACVSEILDLLNSSSDSIEKRIGAVRRKLETLSKFDSSVSPWINDVETALSTFTELETYCGSYLDQTGTTSDPARIEFINSRLAKIQRLRKKYSCTLDELIKKQGLLKHDLDSIENIDADRELLEKQVRDTLEKCKIAGAKLRIVRKNSSDIFDARITAEMKNLGFKEGKWRTDFLPFETPSPQGLETARFLVQTNAGESFLPLSGSASGGEISRLMLAIKSVIAESDDIPVLIFDEIDTGVGGVLAGEVGKAMCRLSRSHQVLCISHLHQIASMADHHFHVYKETVQNRTVTFVKQLETDEKILEIARMLGGDSEISLQHARELLKNKNR